MASVSDNGEVQIPPDRADNIIEREKDALREIKTAINALVAMMGKSKSEGVKAKVEVIAVAFDKMVKLRGELQAEARARIRAAEHVISVAVDKIADRVEALGDKITDGLEQVNGKLADQGTIPAITASAATAAIPPPFHWVTSNSGWRWRKGAGEDRSRL